jgi:hypothetical protein
VNYVFICFSVPLLIIDIPSQGLKDGIKELAANLGLIVAWRSIGLTIVFESLDKL